LKERKLIDRQIGFHFEFFRKAREVYKHS